MYKTIIMHMTTSSKFLIQHTTHVVWCSFKSLAMAYIVTFMRYFIDTIFSEQSLKRTTGSGRNIGP